MAQPFPRSLPRAQPAKAPSTWSRTGCVTCKRRRKKCDQTRPTCSNCVNRGIPCGGYQEPFVSQIIQGHKRKVRSSAGPRNRTPPICPAVNTRITHSALWSPSQNPGYYLHIPPPSAVASNLPRRQRMPTALSLDDLGLAPPLHPGDPFNTFIDGDSISVATATPHTPCSNSSSSPEMVSGGLLASPVGYVNDSTTAADHNACRLDNQLYTDDDSESNGNSLDLGLGFLHAAPLSHNNSLGFPQAMRTFPQLTDQDMYYIQYLHEQGARQLLNMDAGPYNPLRRLLLPRALNSSGMLNAMCAVDACHQAQRADPDRRRGLSVTATGFYVKAANWLWRSFDPSRERPDLGRLGDASLLTALLLCKYEIIQGSVSSWRRHLTGLENLLELRGGVNVLEVDCGQYIASL